MKYKKALYSTWKGMNSRCNNPNNKYYKHYGGRGIKICDKWRNFDCFYEDMGDKPNGTTLDRIDNNGNYCKENCRWATKIEQATNTRTNNFVTHNGETLTLSDWGRKLNISEGTIERRINKYGWSIERALTERPKKPKVYIYNGETAAQASRRLGRSEDFVGARIRSGMSIEEAFTKKPRRW